MSRTVGTEVQAETPQGHTATAEQRLLAELRRQTVDQGRSEMHARIPDLAKAVRCHRSRVSLGLSRLATQGLIDYTPLAGRGLVQTIRVL